MLGSLKYSHNLKDAMEYLNLELATLIFFFRLTLFPKSNPNANLPGMAWPRLRSLGKPTLAIVFIHGFKTAFGCTFNGFAAFNLNGKICTYADLCARHSTPSVGTHSCSRSLRCVPLFEYYLHIVNETLDGARLSSYFQFIFFCILLLCNHPLIIIRRQQT